MDHAKAKAEDTGGTRGKGKGQTYTAAPATTENDGNTESEAEMAASESEPERQPPPSNTAYDQSMQENRELRRRTQHVAYCTNIFSNRGCDGTCGLPHVTWEQHMAMKEVRRAHKNRSGIPIRPLSGSEWSDYPEWEE